MIFFVMKYIFILLYIFKINQYKLYYLFPSDSRRRSDSEAFWPLTSKMYSSMLISIISKIVESSRIHCFLLFFGLTENRLTAPRSSAKSKKQWEKAEFDGFLFLFSWKKKTLALRNISS